MNFYRSSSLNNTTTFSGGSRYSVTFHSNAVNTQPIEEDKRSPEERIYDRRSELFILLKCSRGDKFPTIKKMFRQLIKTVHPDTIGSDIFIDQFRNMQQAYDTLKKEFELIR